MKTSTPIEDTIRNRRSIFPAMYNGATIPDSIIRDILELAKFAPSHRLTQPWRFKVFKGNALSSLGEYLGNYYKENTTSDKYSETKYQKTRTKPIKSSHVIAICISLDKEERVPEWEEIAAVSMAVQNMWLAMSARGIGCYWSTPEAMLNGNQFLNLKQHEKCLGVMYVGVAEIAPAMPPREDMDTKIEWIGF